MKHLRKFNESIKAIDLLEFDRNTPTNLSKREDQMIRDAISPYVGEIRTELISDYWDGDFGPLNMYYCFNYIGQVVDFKQNKFRIYKEDNYYYCNLHILYFDEPYVGTNEFTSFKELLVYLKLAITISFYMYDDLIKIIDSVDFDMDMEFDGELFELIFGDYRRKPIGINHNLNKIKIINSLLSNPHAKLGEDFLHVIRINYPDLIENKMNSLKTFESTDSSFMKNLKKTIYSFTFLALVSSCALQKNTLKDKHKLEPLEKQDSLKASKIRSELKQIINNNSDFDPVIKDKIKSKIDSIMFYTSKLNNIESIGGYVKGTNTIILNKNVFNDDDEIVKNIINHEMLHSIKELDVIKDTMQDFIHPDVLKALYNRMDFKMKIRTHFKNLVDEFYEYDKSSKEMVDNLCNYYTYETVKYITSNDEMFVRYINFKLWLINENQIKSLTDNINKSHIDYFLDKSIEKNLEGTDMFDFVAVYKL